MRSWLAVAVGLSMTAASSLGFAQDAAPANPESPKAPAKPAPAKPAPDKAQPKGEAAAAPAAEGDVRRDPKGIQGVSPFWEGVIKGDRAFIARDFDAAIAGYREAITASPQNALGHYRMGEAQLAKGNLAEAEQSWAAGLRFAGEDQRMRAKLLFVLADLRERQKSLDEAGERWGEYDKLVTSSPEAKGFPGTAPERRKRIDEWKKLLADSAEVKKRIDARLKEAEEAARKSAK